MRFFYHLGNILSYDNRPYNLLINYCMLLLASLTLWLDARISNLTNGQRWRWWLSFLGIAAFQVGLCFAVDCVGISILWNAQIGWMMLRHTRWMQMLFCLTPWRFESAMATLPFRRQATAAAATPLLRTGSSGSYVPNFHSSSLVKAASEGEEWTLRFASFFTQFKITFLAGLAVNLYYLIVAEGITTIAHVGGVMLGVLLAWIDVKIQRAMADPSAGPDEDLLVSCAAV